MSPTAKYIDKIVDEPVAMQCQMPTIQTARQLKMDAMRFDEHKTFATTEEDLEQDSADVPVVMHGQVPVLRRHRTVDASLVQYIDMIIDVPIVKRRQAVSIQTVKKTSESSSDSASLVQKAQKTVEMPSSSSSTRWSTIP